MRFIPEPIPEPVPIIGAGASVATVLSFAGSSIAYNGDFATSKIFDGTFETYTTKGGQTLPFFAQFQLEASYVVTRYKIWPRGIANYPDAPSDYTFEGSDDGVNWTTVDTQVNNPPPFYDVPEATIVDDTYGHVDNEVETPGSYSYYRLRATHTTGPIRQDSNFSIGELQLIGYKS